MQLAVDQMLSRPWFTRVWIYQELVLSKDPWVQCGRTRIRWDVLYAAFVTDQETLGPEGSETPTIILSRLSPHQKRPIEVFSSMHEARKGDAPTLLSVMASRRGFGASNQRDLVYGHLAIARLASKRNVPPCPVVDYQRSITEVFTEATKYMLIIDVHVLIDTDVQSPSRRLKELPSWVPDWSLPASECLVSIPEAFMHMPQRGARWGDKPSSSKLEFPSLEVCCLRCIKLNTVEVVSTIDFSSQSSFTCFSDKHAWERRVLDFRGAYGMNKQPPYASHTSHYREVYQSIGTLLAPITLPPLPDNDELLCRHFDFTEFWKTVYNSRGAVFSVHGASNLY